MRGTVSPGIAERCHSRRQRWEAVCQFGAQSASGWATVSLRPCPCLLRTRGTERAQSIDPPVLSPCFALPLPRSVSVFVFQALFLCPLSGHRVSGTSRLQEARCRSLSQNLLSHEIKAPFPSVTSYCSRDQGKGPSWLGPTRARANTHRHTHKNTHTDTAHTLTQ